jgi:lipoprotein-releasing system permease protein
MKFPLYIARRYFFSRKSTNVINLISFIALIGIAFGSAALIIVLSIFNGFEDLARSMLNAFNPDLKIVSTEGKYFDRRVVESALDSVEEIDAWSFVMTDNALIEYEGKQYIGYVKGVDENFVKVTGLDTMIMYGDFMLYYKSRPMAVVGSGIAYNLGVQLNFIGSLKLWLPCPKSQISFDVSQMFVRTHIFPSGIFSVQKEFDDKYIFVPLSFLQSTLNLDRYTVTACEIKLASDADVSAIEQKIQGKIGDGFNVKNRFEQQQMFYKIVRSERLAIIMILTFIIIIASFNVIATISMLIIDKRKDIEVLNFLGADSRIP